MDAEQYLLAALTSVTGALLFVAKILWKRSEDCETDRRALRQEIEDVKTNNGRLEGFHSAVAACPVRGCTLRQVARPSRYSHPEAEWPNREIPPPDHA